MKKKALKNLKLEKQTISNLEKNTINGGYQSGFSCVSAKTHCKLCLVEIPPDHNNQFSIGALCNTTSEGC